MARCFILTLYFYVIFYIIINLDLQELKWIKILTFLDTFRSVTNPVSPNTVQVGLLSTQYISKLASVYGVQLWPTSHESELRERTCVRYIGAWNVVTLPNAAIVGFIQPLLVGLLRPVRVMRIVFDRFVVNRVCMIILVWFVVLVHYVKRNYINAKNKTQEFDHFK